MCGLSAGFIHISRAENKSPIHLGCFAMFYGISFYVRIEIDECSGGLVQSAKLQSYPGSRLLRL